MVVAGLCQLMLVSYVWYCPAFCPFLCISWEIISSFWLLDFIWLLIGSHLIFYSKVLVIWFRFLNKNMSYFAEFCWLFHVFLSKSWNFYLDLLWKSGVLIEQVKFWFEINEYFLLKAPNLIGVETSLEAGEV